MIQCLCYVEQCIQHHNIITTPSQQCLQPLSVKEIDMHMLGQWLAIPDVLEMICTLDAFLISRWTHSDVSSKVYEAYMGLQEIAWVNMLSFLADVSDGRPRQVLQMMKSPNGSDRETALKSLQGVVEELVKNLGEPPTMKSLLDSTVQEVQEVRETKTR